MDRYLIRRADLDPNWATIAGLHDRDTRLTRYDDASLAARRAFFETPPACDDPLDRAVLELEFAAQRFEMDRWERRAWMPSLALEPLWLVHTMLTKDYAPIEKRRADAQARMRDLPALLGDLRLDRPPRPWTQATIDDLATVPAFLADLGLDDGGAYARYADFLRREVLPRSDGDFAVGEDVYNRLVRVQHGLDLDAEALLALGRREFERTREEMVALAGGDLVGTIERIKAHHPTSAGLRDAYARETARARELMRDLFDIPADDELEIIDTPAFMRSHCPFAAYSAPAPMDTSRVGHFFVTPAETEEQLRGHDYADIENTVLHEAYPGHHLQLITAKRIKSTVRRLADAPTLVEGWGLYCEELGHETGFYSGPDARLMALNWRLHRAARVILDVSLHTRRMTFDEAVEFLILEVHLQRSQAQASVLAYTRAPTYFMSYLVGMRELMRVRDAAGLPLREFHRRVLGLGNVPVGLVAGAIA